MLVPATKDSRDDDTGPSWGLPTVGTESWNSGKCHPKRAGLALQCKHLPFHLSSTSIGQVKSRSRSESPRTIFVNSVLMIRHKIGFERSNAFPETAILALNILTPARPGRAVRTERLIFVPIHTPGITKNDSSSTAPEAVSQLTNSCAAQVEGQVLMSEGKTYPLRMSFTK